jgi:hypothetical protein
MTIQQLLRARELRSKGYTMEGTARALSVEVDVLRPLLAAYGKKITRKKQRELKKKRTTPTFAPFPPTNEYRVVGTVDTNEGSTVWGRKEVEETLVCARVVPENRSIPENPGFSHTLTHAPNSNEKAGAEKMKKRPRPPSIPSWPKDRTTILSLLRGGSEPRVVFANFPMTPAEEANIIKYLEDNLAWERNEREARRRAQQAS